MINIIECKGLNSYKGSSKVFDGYWEFLNVSEGSQEFPRVSMYV